MRAQRESHLSHSHGCKLTNWWKESQHLAGRQSTASRYSSKLAWLQPPSLHNHGIQVHLQPCSIPTSKCISKLAQLQPPNASSNFLNYSLQSSHDHGLPSANIQTHSIMASKYMSKLARLRPPSSHDHALQVHLYTHSTKISECISIFTRSRPGSVSPNMLDYHLQVHPQTRSITAWESISEFTRSSFSGAPQFCSQAPPAASPDIRCWWVAI